MITFSVAVGQVAATVEWDAERYAPDAVADMARQAVKAAVMAHRLDREVERDG